VFLEKLGLRDVRQKLNKLLFFFIALGVLLPMMHQSSLGTMLVVMGSQVNPLWQTPLQPVIYLLTAIVIGYGVVLFESCVASSAYRLKIETHLLDPLAKIMLGVLALYLVVRVADLTVRGAWSGAFAPSWVSVSFWVENIGFIAPFFLIGTAQARRNPARLFLAGIAIMVGGVLLRLNGFMIGYEHHTGTGWSYFPSVGEIMVTTGMFAIEVLGYIIITRRFPVLPRETARAVG
jgi:Ni/Fe-hydrogenase subunit HybB-like protein